MSSDETLRITQVCMLPLHLSRQVATASVEPGSFVTEVTGEPDLGLLYGTEVHTDIPEFVYRRSEW
jgi:hypothetical protein